MLFKLFVLIINELIIISRWKWWSSITRSSYCIKQHTTCIYIHWALWRTLMRMEYFFFVHPTTSILAKLSTWCFEHSGDISCSLLVNLSHTNESWEGRNTSLWIYALNLFIEHSGEHWWEWNIFCLFTTPQAFWLSTWCFEHTGDISCFLLINPSHTDESWKGRNTCLWIYALNLFIEHSGEH